MTVVSTAEAKKSYFLSDYDVTLDLLMDGSYEVKEVIAFDFSGGEYTYAFRKIRARNLDSIRNFSVSSEEVTITNFKLEKDGSYYELRWEFEPVAIPVTFNLSYEVIGALQVKDGMNRIHWTAVGKEWNVEVQDIDVRVNIPFSDIKADSVEVDPEATNIGEVIEAEGIFYEFHYDRLKKKKHYTIIVDFPQRLPGRVDNTDRNVLRFVAFSFAIALAMLIGWLRFEMKNPRPGPDPRPVDPSVENLLDSAYLINDGSTSRKKMFSALIFDLASRGNIKLRRFVNPSKWSRSEVVGIDVLHTDGMNKIEKEVMEKVVSYPHLKAFGEKASSFQSAILKIIRSHLTEKGYFQDISGESKTLFWYGLVAFALIFFSFYIQWYHSVVFTFISSYLFTLSSFRYRITSGGAEKKASIKAYLQEVREGVVETQKSDPVAAVGLFMKNLPWHLIDPKIGPSWMEKLKKSLKTVDSSIEIPDWFEDTIGLKKEAESEALASFIPLHSTIIATSSTAGGAGASSAAGAAGGGAAGGGGGGAG
jgi:hypothetical protein